MVSNFILDIVNIFRQPLYLRQAGESVVVVASVGITMYPDSGKTPEELVKIADIAMYTVKVNGKGGYKRFTYEMERQVLAKG